MTHEPRVELQLGFTSPDFRYWPAARPPKREPIGFVHFGPVEEERDVVLVHPDDKIKQEDRADKWRWIEAMTDDELDQTYI